MTNCPCCSGKLYQNCCKTLIENNQVATTPEQLMRSRYTAYATCNINYIEQTMKGPALENFHFQEAETWAKKVQWLGLEVLSAKMQKNKGFVEFIAHFQEQNNKQCIREVSEFHFIEDKWYYIDGVIPKLPKDPGRNDSCPCGSNKKYKKCCLNK